MESDQKGLNSLENLKLSSLHKLCRACLYEAEPPFPLFAGPETLSDMMWSCFELKLIETEGFPSALCPRCCDELTRASQFKNKVKHSTQLLEQYARFTIKSEFEEFPIKFESVNQQHENSTRRHKKNKNLQSDNDDEAKDDIKPDINQFDDCMDNHDNDFVEVNIIEHGDVKAEQSGNEDDKKNYICDICQRPLSSKYSLQHHMKTRHNDEKKQDIGKVSGWGTKRRFHCKECDYSTPLRQSLVYHMRVHTGEKPYKCDECNKCFSQQGSLSCHKKTHSDKTYFTCAECGKQFKYKAKYEAHKSVHTEERNFICTICNKGLKTKSTLDDHMNRHLNIKNFSCETCGSTFVTRVELLNHSKTHFAVRRFACNMCEFKTHVKKSLECHLQRHKGDRPFKCDLCELSCYSKRELMLHKYKHTKEKNYCCPVCNTRFVQACSLNKHMLKSHGIKNNRSNVDRRIVK